MPKLYISRVPKHKIGQVFYVQISTDLICQVILSNSHQFHTVFITEKYVLVEVYIMIVERAKNRAIWTTAVFKPVLRVRRDVLPKHARTAKP